MSEQRKAINKMGCFFSIPSFRPLSNISKNVVSGKNKTKPSIEWKWSGKVYSLEELSAVLSGTVAFEPNLPETVASHPASSWEGAQLNCSVFPEGRGKPSGFSTCPRWQNTKCILKA